MTIRSERDTPARLPTARRRQQLLDVALEVFAERGFHPTSMNDLAEAAGVAEPVLYQHFRSKRELYRELLDDVGSRLGAAIEKATSEAAGPREQVERGFTAYFRFVDDEQAAFQILFGGGTHHDEEFARRVHEVEEAMADRIAVLIEVEGLDPGRRRVLAHGIVGLAEATVRHWLRTGRPGTPEQLAHTAAALAWGGLRSIR